jgi:dolichol kinase
MLISGSSALLRRVATAPLLARSAPLSASFADASASSLLLAAGNVPSAAATAVTAFVAVPAPARNAACAVLLLLSSIAWIKLCNLMSSAGITSQYVSRKLVHMGSGPLFVLCWPLFTTGLGGQLAALCVPILSVLRLLRAGRAPADSAAGAELVRAISRSGDKKEALEGPMVYTLVLVAATAFGWRSLVSVVAVNQMAIGDGMADIIGRKFGRNRWPKWIEKSGKKSVEGSVAFAFFAFVACALMVELFKLSGLAAIGAAQAAPALLLISVVAAIVELLPLGDDNLTVPLTSAVLAAILLGRA